MIATGDRNRYSIWDKGREAMSTVQTPILNGKRRTYAARSIHLHWVQNLQIVSFHGCIHGV